MPEETKQPVNGVDVAQLFETIDAIKEKPDVAKFNFRINNKWINGGQNRTTIKDFYGACEAHPHSEAFVLDADEPPVLLGADQGANPVEFALHALAACLTTTLIYHAAAQGIKIDSLESTLEGDLDLHGFLGLSDSVRNGTVKLTKAGQDSPQNGRSPAIAQLTHVTSLQSEKARARRSR